MKPSELNQILKEVVAEELTKEGYIGHPEWDEEHGDGYTNDAQRAFAHSQMTTPRHNDTKKAQELAKKGKHVVIVADDVHCKSTDAVLGQCISIHSVHNDKASAWHQAEKLNASGQDANVIGPESVAPKAQEPSKPASPEDDVPFEEGKRICSWCKKDMGQSPTDSDTHGICPDCEKGFNDEIEQMKDNPDPALMARQTKLEALKKRRDPDGIEEVNYTQTSAGQSVIAQGAPGSVVRFVTENPEVMKQMREWAKDCQWKEDPEEIDEMSDEEILRGVQRHYEGGIKAFIRDSQSKAEVPVGYKEGYGMGDMSKDPKKAFKKARWTVKFDENISASELKSLVKEVISEELNEAYPGDKWNPVQFTRSPDIVADLIFSLKDGQGITFMYDKEGRSNVWEAVEKVIEGDEYAYRMFGPGDGKKYPLETDEEVRDFAKSVVNNPHLQYYEYHTIHDYKRPEARYSQDDDQQVGDYEKYGPDPIRWQDVTEETWPTADEKLKQYEDVKEWERDNLDGLHKYKGEPLKNHGFPYKVGDLVPAGTYNRNNAMHLWNMAKKQRQQHLKLGPPAGFGWSDPKKLYEAKGITSKEKLRSIIKESVHAVLKENTGDHEESREVELATQIKNLAHSMSFDRDHPYFNHIVRVGKLADEILKLHTNSSEPQKSWKDLEGDMMKIHNEPAQEKTALGVTQETISRTKKVLEQMLFQKRKK